jgi:hypothetical protein
MSNYSGSLNHALAEGHSGHMLGLGQGLSQGLVAGYDRGEADGYSKGYRAGYDACVGVANTEIQKCMAYIRQHVADKKSLAEQASAQHELILQLRSALNGLDAENQKLRQCLGGVELARLR